MYRKYYSYNDMPYINKDLPKAMPEEVHKKESEKPAVPSPSEATARRDKPSSSSSGGLLSGLAADDIILGAVILALLTDGCDDKLLLLALAFIFLS